MYEERSRTIDWKARAERVRAEREEVAALAIKWGVPLPWGPYRAAARSCFKCGERIVVYTWRGQGPERATNGAGGLGPRRRCARRRRAPGVVRRPDGGVGRRQPRVAGGPGAG